MIVERRTEKRCNICKRLLAIKRFLFFRNVVDYVPVMMEIAGITGNDTYEAHICQDCWERMKMKIQIELQEDK